MASSGDLTPEQYEMLFGEAPPAANPIGLATARPIIAMSNAPNNSTAAKPRWDRRRTSRAIQFGVLLIALAGAIFLFGIAADSLLNSAASGS